MTKKTKLQGQTESNFQSFRSIDHNINSVYVYVVIFKKIILSLDTFVRIVETAKEIEIIKLF